MAKDDTTLRLREEGLNWREIDGEVVVLDLERSHYLNLNETGAVLWVLLAEGATQRQLVDRLIEEFDVGELNGRRRRRGLRRDLPENGLLAILRDPEPPAV